jgi:hypothetical protein
MEPSMKTKQVAKRRSPPGPPNLVLQSVQLRTQLTKRHAKELQMLIALEQEVKALRVYRTRNVDLATALVLQRARNADYERAIREVAPDKATEIFFRAAHLEKARATDRPIG